MTVFRAFTNRSFLLLWSGQIVSRLGDSLFTVALAWWVLQKTGSATVMGVVLICSTIPMILCLLFGGVAVDRFPRVRLMLASDLLRAGVTVLIAALAFLQWLELWHIFVLSAIFGIVDAFFSPAYTALIPDLVPSELLPSANSLRSISTQAAQFIGPVIAAAIIALGGTSLAFALDGISFALSAACLGMFPRASVPRLPAEKAKGVLLDMREGISTVLHSPWLWVTLVIASERDVLAWALQTPASAGATHVWCVVARESGASGYGLASASGRGERGIFHSGRSSRSPGIGLDEYPARVCAR